MKQSIPMNLFILVSLVFSANAQQLPAPNVIPSSTEIGESVNVDETIYYVYDDGSYKEAVLTRDPELIGGRALMETLIQLNIKYPEKAREQKIGGTVLVSVVIDEEGNMEDAFIHEGICGGFNDAALRAVKLLEHTGFTPGEIKGKAVMVKFDIPITFLPQ